MGYQPKYIKKDTKSAAPARSPKQTSASREEPAQNPKPAAKSNLPAPVTALLVLLSLALVVLLLRQMIFTVSRGTTAAKSNPVNTGVKAQFSSDLDTRMAQLRQNLALGTGETTPDGGADTPAPTEPVKVVYEIPAGTQVAPAPNQECFGKTDDPTSLQWLLDEAKTVLDGQSLFFTTDVVLYPGSEVHYYLDDTIFAITWKQVQDGGVYTYSEVKVNHPSQFRRHLSAGEYGSGMYYTTTEMAETANAVVASGGDFYSQRTFGVCVFDGELKKMDGTYSQTCFIDSNGDMSFVYGGDLLRKDEARAYIEENDIQFSLCFGPVLVDNYEVRETSSYGVGEPKDHYARAALCQMDTLHYLVAVANQEGDYQRVPTVTEFAHQVALTGCRMAYSLDGGQTASIVMNNELINRPVYGEQRKISDIIYFATAIPEGE